jgi:hypothetical protein
MLSFTIKSIMLNGIYAEGHFDERCGALLGRCVTVV